MFRNFTFSLFIFIGFTMCSSHSSQNTTFNTKIPSIEGKWAILNYGNYGKLSGDMHVSFRIEFHHDSTGSYYHYKNELNKSNFKYEVQGNKLTIKCDRIESESSILGGYREFYFKTKVVHFSKAKFKSIELMTSDSNVFVIGRPFSYPLYWEEE